MRIFCPATLSVLFLPLGRRTGRSACSTSSAQSPSRGNPSDSNCLRAHTTVKNVDDQAWPDSVAALHLSWFSGPRGRACRDSAHSSALKLSLQPSESNEIRTDRAGVPDALTWSAGLMFLLSRPFGRLTCFRPHACASRVQATRPVCRRPGSRSTRARSIATALTYRAVR